MATPSPSRQRPHIQAGGIRRSFTQPPRSLSFHERAGLDPSDSAADILYSHPRSRIVSFTPPTDAVRSVSSPGLIDLDYPIDTIETLPWASSTEDVLASGSLIIEKIRGSTNFLKSGTKPLHALMRNSQCWCVDGEATLVMRVGAFKYYRIELPYETEDDKAEVQKLKDVLTRILRFEATPCPFKRGFHVDLPESATTPRKKGPWKRRPGSSLSSPSSAPPSPLSLKKSRAQAAPREQDTQSEVGPSHDDGEDVSEEGMSDTSPLEEEDLNGHRRIVVEDEGSGNKIVSDPQQGRQIPDLSPNLTSTSDKSGVRLAEADDDAEEAPNTADDQLLSHPLAVAHNSLESSDGQLQDRSEDNLGVKELSEELDSCNSPSHSLDRLGSEDGGPESPEKSTSFADQQPQLPPDSPPSVIDLYVVPDNSLHKTNVIPNGLEQPTAKCPADLSDSTQILIETFSNQGIHDNCESIEAEEASESGLKSGVQPAEPHEPAQVRPGSIALSTNGASFGEDCVEGNAEGTADDIDQQRTSSGSDSKVSDTVSVSSCADSFHSIASSEERPSVLEADSAGSSDPVPPPDAHDSLTLFHIQHRRDISEMTVTVANAPILESEVPVSPLRPSTATSEGPSTPSLLRSSASDSSWPEVETPTAVATDNNLRRRTKRQRSFSPLPPSSTLFPTSPPSPRGNHLSGAILRKACNLALGKPIEAVFMLVHILARIAAGATVNDLMNGDLFRLPTGPDTAHRRNHSLPDQLGRPKSEVSEDDDYGVPVRGRSRSAVPRVRKDDDADSLFDLD